MFSRSKKKIFGKNQSTFSNIGSNFAGLNGILEKNVSSTISTPPPH